MKHAFAPVRRLAAVLLILPFCVPAAPAAAQTAAEAATFLAEAQKRLLELSIEA